VTKVYIASPYTKGDVAANVRQSMDAFEELASLGFIPYCPLLTHFQHMVHPRNYEFWLSYDLEWLAVCDVMIRIDGESAGADKEERFANEHGIPVIHVTGTEWIGSAVTKRIGEMLREERNAKSVSNRT